MRLLTLDQFVALGDFLFIPVGLDHLFQDWVVQRVLCDVFLNNSCFGLELYVAFASNLFVEKVVLCVQLLIRLALHFVFIFLGRFGHFFGRLSLL